MTNRRSFFSALFTASAAPLAAAAIPLTVPSPAAPVMVNARPRIPDCECGGQFVSRGDNIGNRRFMSCSSPYCRFFDLPLAIPLVAVFAADPVTVQRVRLAEAEHEREDTRRHLDYMRAMKENPMRYYTDARLRYVSPGLSSLL